MRSNDEDRPQPVDESHLDKAVPHQKIKRIGHGYRNFANYRLRLLLHCGVRWQTHRTARLRSRSSRLVT